MRLRSTALLMLLAATLASGCASSSSYAITNSSEKCDKSVKNYNKMLRWNEADKAGIAFVDVKHRLAFKQAVDSMKKREINITDFRIQVTECGLQKKDIEAVVEFDYYQLTSGKLKTVTDRQIWVYQDSTDGVPAGWRITSPLPAFK